MCSGCAANLERLAMDSFQPTISAYHDGLRWKEFHRAARMIPSAERGRFVAQREANEAVFDIVDYEIREVRWKTLESAEGAEDPFRATVIVEFRHVWKNEGVLRVTRMEQQWEFDGEQWLLRAQSEVREDGTSGPAATSGELL
jgi:hypothetical protein